MADRTYYEISTDYFIRIVYDTQDIIKTVCEWVNAYGVDPDNIIIDTYINGRKESNQ